MSGYIYVAYCTSLSHKKIGKSNDKTSLQSRFNAYKTIVPNIMMIAYACRNYHEAEKCVHALLSNFIVKESSQESPECFKVSLETAKQAIMLAVNSKDNDYSLDSNKLTIHNSQITRRNIESMGKSDKDLAGELAYKPHNVITIYDLDGEVTYVPSKVKDELEERFNKLTLQNTVVNKEAIVTWIQQHTIVDMSADKVNAVNIYNNFAKYCESKCYLPPDRRTFSTILKQTLGIKKYTTIDNVRYIVGWKLV